MPETPANHEPAARRRSAADATPDRLFFVTDTGKRLCCSVTSIGPEHEPHWMIADSDGALYVGPEASAVHSDSPLDFITSWWKSRTSPIAPRAD